MSANSSDNKPLQHTSHGSDVPAKKKRSALRKPSFRRKGQPSHTFNWRMVVALPLWVLASFIAAQLVLAVVLWILNVANVSLLNLASETVIQTILSTLVYLLAFAITFGVPYIVKQREVSLKTLGIDRLPSWSDIGLAPLGFVAYGLLTALLLFIATTYFPGFPSSQAQDVGFQSLNGRTEMLLAFATLVVLAPIAEEVLFRGYLYGKLRKYSSILPSIVITSLLFGAVHMQWNVGLDTFALSVVMCCLREVTGSVWAGVLLHMIKNGIAFYLLFVGPMVTPGL
ncbi:MAG: CPBP family intramembrane metalloprotease [Chloroflexi bacterium]|nr:MAG: CPBP family intramembrane metalloprotease [Chloroflexota bacterium]